MATLGGTSAQKVAFMLDTASPSPEAKAVRVSAMQAAAASTRARALRFLGVLIGSFLLKKKISHDAIMTENARTHEPS